MTLKSGKDRTSKIIDSLKSAAEGDYSKKLDFASDDSYLGKIARAVNTLLEITGEKHASPSQRPSESDENGRRYRHLLDNIEESYFEVDLKGNLTFFNDTVARALGYNPEELSGINYRQLVAETSAKTAYDVFHQVFLTGQPIKRFDWEILKKNGENLQVESSVALRRDHTGKPVGFRGIVRDVSWRIQYQKDLWQSEEKYRTILDIMDEGYLEENLTGRIIFVNDAACRLIGYPREKLVGMHYREYLTPAVAETMKAVFQRVYRTGSPEKLVDYDLVRKDGSVITYELNAALKHDASGKPCGFLVLTKDVSRRKEAEAQRRLSEVKYQNILEIMGEGYFESDLDGTLTYVNDAGCQLVGYSREELIGQNYTHYASAETREHIFGVYREIYRTGAPRFMLDYDIIRKDGSIRTHQQNVALFYDESGRAKGFRALVRDVTERKKAEDALRDSEQKYRHILENMEEAYLEADLKGNFLFFNDSFCRTLGYTREELQNANYRLIDPPGQENHLFEMFNEIYRTGQTKTFLNHAVRAKNGSLVYLEMSVSVMRSPAGDPIGFNGISRDVTARLRTERAIQESEKHLRMITDNIHDIIWTMDFNLRWTYLSPSVLRMTGFSPEAVMQMPLKAILPPDTYRMVEQGLADALSEETTGPVPGEQRQTVFELPMMHKNGTRIWFEISTSFNRDEHGKPFEIVGVTRDITARKKAEEALAVSERRYRLMAENVNDIIWIMNPDMNFTYISPSCLEATGYTPEETKTTPLTELLTPESFTRATQRLADELMLERSGRPFDPQRAITLEVEAIHKNGSILFLEITGTFNRNDKGEITEILILGRDFTERKKMEEALRESEKRYRMIIENMHEVIWTSNLDMQSTYISPSCYRLTGYTPAEIMSSPLDQIMTPETLASTAQAVAEELAHESSVLPADPYRSRTVEQEIYCKNGQTVWIEVTGTFIRNEQGKASGMLMAGRDITARKKAEEAKEKLEQQLIQAQKMETVGRLAGGVAHDFNNMLSVILGYVDLAKLRLARQHPVLKDIAEIEKAANRSRDITMQLLAFSRKQIIEPRIINLNDLVVHSQKALIRLIGEDIELKVVAGEDLWDIKFDPSQIEQILINLAVNARDAMQGGGKLTIETENQSLDSDYCELHAGFAPGHYVRLSFSDNGIGMDKETLQHIFEPFFTTKEAGRGTGLGLSTVYGIVQQNNGLINVYSEPGRGTTFSIYLPRTTEKEKTREEADEGPEIAGQGNILLVEDDAMVLEITRGMLESIGYTVTATGSSQDAIALFSRQEIPFDLVITDVVMPGMSGKDLRNRLAEIRPDVQVLFMSGYTADVIAHHNILEEGVQFIQKPFTIQSLARKTAEAIKVKR